ncbi:MAG: DUF3619 family protein [Gammaproteobacteria bacterium]
MSKDNQNVDDENVISKVCGALDDSVNRIDADTSQRLVTARKNALQHTQKRFSVPKLFTAAATAFSILIAVIIVTTQFNQPFETEDPQVIEIAATQDTTELYEELEFYTWLVEEDVTS